MFTPVSPNDCFSAELFFFGYFYFLQSVLLRSSVISYVFLRTFFSVSGWMFLGFEFASIFGSLLTNWFALIMEEISHCDLLVYVFGVRMALFVLGVTSMMSKGVLLLYSQLN